MNYIKQINAFWKWRKYNNDISHSAADLYFAILNCANEAGWKKQVNIPNSTLMATAQIGNKSVLASLRNILAQKGLIKYISGKKGKAPGYIVVTLYDADTNLGYDIGSAQNTDIKTDSDIGSAQDTDLHNYKATDKAANQNTNQRTIYKQKQNENKTTAVTATDYDMSEFSDCYKNLTGNSLTQTAVSDIAGFIDKGVGRDLILAVMDYAADLGKKNWGYMRATLEGLLSEGIKTVEAWRKQQAEYKRKKQGGTQQTQKTKFNNFENSEKIDYDALQAKLVDMFMAT